MALNTNSADVFQTIHDFGAPEAPFDFGNQEMVHIDSEALNGTYEVVPTLLMEHSPTAVEGHLQPFDMHDPNAVHLQNVYIFHVTQRNDAVDDNVQDVQQDDGDSDDVFSWLYDVFKKWWSFRQY